MPSASLVAIAIILAAIGLPVEAIGVLMVFDRILDMAAAELGMDRAALRRRNLLSPDELPYTTGAGARIDCGDFATVLDRTLAMADYDVTADRSRFLMVTSATDASLRQEIVVVENWVRELTERVPVP